MAISIQYVVTYKGVEKLVTTDKKAADQYDKMLDVADNLQQYLTAKGVAMSEAELESLTFLLAQEKLNVSKLLKGSPADQLLAEDAAEVVEINSAKAS
ncbi:YebG family protein [Alteromonas sp. ASW11-36]|uniref:YebG family protein n=1 Tax=Alteromonas arenosi TaxID=3055817 RepID=A0ABT7T101_9ALTE|nr:YebG family protein [Alteromonas sp. ASW11-36]MDM7862096.1 YebG family protein [Alteromonas sp. ASW11-36]